MVRPGRVGVLNIAPAGVFVAALIPLTLNFHAASRAHGPEATLARDFAYDLLQTIEPYGIVFHQRGQRHLPAVVPAGSGRDSA